MGKYLSHSGYGLPNQNLNEVIDEELRTLHRGQDNLPQMYTPKTAKPIMNKQLFDKVKQLQERDGIEDGFSFRYLWEAVFSEQPNFVSQKIGSCVTSSSMRMLAFRGLAEVTLFDQPEDLPGTEMVGKENNILTFAPYAYRAGRSLVGINGGSPADDGSLVNYHIQGLETYGALLCSDPDLTSDTYPEPQDVAAYRKWGADDNLLNKFKNSEHKLFLTESTQVTSFDELRKAIGDMKPVHVGSGFAFKTQNAINGYTVGGKNVPLSVRDNRDSWQHAMGIPGAYKIRGQWYAEVLNQWDGYHGGFEWFTITAEEFDRWSNPQSKSIMMTKGELLMPSSDQYAF